MQFHLSTVQDEDGLTFFMVLNGKSCNTMFGGTSLFEFDSLKLCVNTAIEVLFRNLEKEISNENLQRLQEK